MAEWFMAFVLKTKVENPTVGSNPTLFVITYMLSQNFFILLNFKGILVGIPYFYSKSPMVFVNLACFFSIFFSLMVIKAKHPVYALLSLITAFVCVSFIFLLLGVSFLPLILVIVYAGAVAVLFLFVIMLFSSLTRSEMDIDSKFYYKSDLGLLLMFVYLFFISSSSLVKASSINIHKSEQSWVFQSLERINIDDIVPISSLLYGRY
jgi:NADH:ubiquinone oxidoreductase subunit 6 (subunit J)